MDRTEFLFYTTGMSKTTDWAIDELNKEGRMTACGKCKNLIKKPGMWKDFNAGLFCRAMPKQGDFNCFTGEYLPNEMWRCVEVNTGNCASYEEVEE